MASVTGRMGISQQEHRETSKRHASGWSVGKFRGSSAGPLRDQAHPVAKRCSVLWLFMGLGGMHPQDVRLSRSPRLKITISVWAYTVYTYRDDLPTAITYCSKLCGVVHVRVVLSSPLAAWSDVDVRKLGQARLLFGQRGPVPPRPQLHVVRPCCFPPAAGDPGFSGDPFTDLDCRFPSQNSIWQGFRSSHSTILRRYLKT
jgi:hypothetical protein